MSCFRTERNTSIEHDKLDVRRRLPQWATRSQCHIAALRQSADRRTDQKADGTPCPPPPNFVAAPSVPDVPWPTSPWKPRFLEAQVLEARHNTEQTNEEGQPPLLAMHLRTSFRSYRTRTNRQKPPKTARGRPKTTVSRSRTLHDQNTEDSSIRPILATRRFGVKSFPATSATENPHFPQIPILIPFI